MKLIKKCLDLHRKYKEQINYLIVGGLTTLVSMAVYYGGIHSVLDPDNAIQLQVANILSWVAGVSFAYVTNRKYVFESQNSNILKEAASFVSSRVTTLFLDMAVMGILVTWLGQNEDICKIVSSVLVTVANYFLSKLLVFRKSGKAKEAA